MLLRSCKQLPKALIRFCTRLTENSACVASLERAVVSFKIVGSHDQTYDLIPLALWSYAIPPSLNTPPRPFQTSHAHWPSPPIFTRDAEIALGIMCSCMPTLPKFFRHLVPKIKSRVSSYRKSKGERGSFTASGGSIVSPATTSWERYDDSRRLQSASPAPEIEMVGLEQQTPMDKTAMPHGDFKAHFGEMAKGNTTVARNERMGGDLEDGLRQWNFSYGWVFASPTRGMSGNIEYSSPIRTILIIDK